jgi:serine/threonine protein kinase
MAANTQTADRFSDLLAESGQVDEGRALRIIEQLTQQIAAIHADGRLHRSISVDRVVIVGDRAELVAANTHDAHIEGEFLPPELQHRDLPQLPERLDEARSFLKSVGIDLDPRRIDIYQLGCLACKMLAGASPQTYLFSPRAKARIPVRWRRVIDGMLGYESARRIATCDELQTELKRAAAGELQPASPETPPRGTGIDALTNTPRTPHPPATPLSFDKLGNYQIVGRLGSGGMGDVYRGYDPQLERSVALKVLPPELARQSDFVRRFVDEAKAAARLVHPNIVQIYSIGEDEGRHYFAMQYIAGETLAARLARQKRLSLDDTLSILEQVLSGLAVAHRQGMIHRDIKPGNILLETEHGRALLADFGLVKSLDSTEQMTATGMVMGTVDYISPEQGRGHKVDTRSDLYSVGVLMYQMLSGQLPFVAESATAMIFQHAYERPRALEDFVPDVAPGASAIIRRLMAKDPADRYQTAEDLLADIGALHAAHDWQPAAIEPQQENPKSIVISLADIHSEVDERRLTAALAPLPRPRWQDRLRVLFHLHSPALLKNLQNTEQQVEGALAVYQARRDELAGLAHEAVAVERALAAQHLDAELREQQAAREEIELRLAKADATLQKLRNQRGLLRARLRAVEVANVIGGGKTPRSTLQSSFIRMAILAVALLIAWIAFDFARSTFHVFHTGRDEVVGLKTPVKSAETPGNNAIVAASGWINLTPYINLQLDTVGGNWNVSGDNIHVGPSTKAVYLKIPILVRGSYEFQFKYRAAAAGNRALTVRLPVGGARAALRIAQDSGIGINGIRGLGAIDPDNPTANPNFPNPADVERLVQVRVELGSAGAAHITVSVDGEKQINWTGKETEIQMADSNTGMTLPNDPLLILAGWGRGVVFHDLALHMLDGSAVPWSRNPAPLPSTSEWTSLAPLVDLAKDALGSKWEVLDETIRNEPLALPSQSNFLTVPLLIRGSYELRFKYEIADAANRGLNVRFPVGDQRAALVIGETRRENGIGVNGILGLDSNHPSNPTTDLEFSNPVGVEREALLRIELMSSGAVHLSVAIDGRKQIDWSGPVEQVRLLDSKNGARLPKEPIIILHGWGNRVTFRQLAIRMLDGSVTPWRVAAFAPPPKRVAPKPGSPLEVLTSNEWEWSKPVNAGTVINSDKNEGSPFVSADGLTLLFDSNRGGGLGGVDIWMSHRKAVDQPWDKPVNLGPPVNSDKDDYHATMTADGFNMLFSSTRAGGLGANDLYFASRPSADGPWTRVVNMGRPINSNLNERASFLAPDSLTLLLGTDRPGGVGRNDLWIARRQTNTQRWGRLENLGALVNSDRADKSPSLSSDGLVLVFQSDRSGGSGKNDLYMATRSSLGEPFGKAVNLGSTINSDANEENPALSADGKTLWFSTNRAGGAGGFDIWYSERVKRTK